MGWNRLGPKGEESEKKTEVCRQNVLMRKCSDDTIELCMLWRLNDLEDDKVGKEGYLARNELGHLDQETTGFLGTTTGSMGPDREVQATADPSTNVPLDVLAM
jgi:hypothetical protein